MARTASRSRNGAVTRAGGLANVQYPQWSRHSMVSAMNTFGENVTRMGCSASRTADAAASSSGRGVSRVATASRRLSMVAC